MYIYIQLQVQRILNREAGFFDKMQDKTVKVKFLLQSQLPCLKIKDPALLTFM